MKIVALLLALALQVPDAAPLTAVRETLRKLNTELDQHRPTYGGTPELTTAKHQLRDWIETRLTSAGSSVDPQAFVDGVHTAFAGASLLCDDCDWNQLGYLDDIRVFRQDRFLLVITAVGISCGYDESAYVYAWADGAWHRLFEDEQNTYTFLGYLPQTIHDIEMSSPDEKGERVLLTLGSQTICGGAFKNVYARAWRLGADDHFVLALDRAEKANDETPPIEGRVLPGDVFYRFTAGGFLDGDVHPALRHFKIDGGPAVQADPIAARPRDFVLEWLSAPWEESQKRSDSPSLEALHAELHRDDSAGDFPDPTRRCGAGSEFWQVRTNLYEKPKRYFRVRWQTPFTFTMVGISETPYPDCTTNDQQSEALPNLLTTVR